MALLVATARRGVRMGVQYRLILGVPARGMRVQRQQLLLGPLTAASSGPGGITGEALRGPATTGIGFRITPGAGAGIR